MAIFCFARRARGNGTIARHAKLFHHFLKVCKSFNSLFEDFFAETVANENALAEAQGIAFVVEWLEVDCGVRANYGKTHCVGTGINRGNVNRF